MGTRHKSASPSNRLAAIARRAATAWCNLKLEQRFLIGVALVLALTLPLAVAVYQNSLHFIETTVGAERNQEVLMTLATTLSTLTEAEGQQRVYLIHGDNSSLNSYQRASSRLRSSVARVKNSTAHDPAQQQRCASLGNQIHDRLRLLDETIRLRGKGGLSAAQKNLGNGMQSLNAVRKLIAQMEDTEELSLSRRTAAMEAFAGRMKLTLGLSAWLAATLLPLMYYHAKRAAADLRESKEALRESDLRFRIVTRAADEAVWDWNLANNSVWWNQGVQTLFGFEENQIGLDHAWWVTNLHPEDRERVASTVQNMVQGADEFWSAEYRFRRADDSFADVLDRGYVLRDSHGKATRMIGAMQDITQRKRELELARSRDAALESARLKSQFLANMSHEIRTPMNSIIGMTGLLLNTDLSPKQREYVNIVNFSGDTLLTIINDILDFSKIEAGKLTFETVDFDLRTTVREVIDLMAEQAQTKKLKLASSVPAGVPTALRGDAGRLRQVLTNLVGNAIKFTHQGEINIRVSRDKETATHAVVRFEVADTGIGMTEEIRAHLFQPFTQGDPSTTRKFGGTGLGLAICKQLVQLMAGEIGVDIVPGKGSTFWFTARFEKSRHRPPAAAKPDDANRTGTAAAPSNGSAAPLPETLSAERRKTTRLLVVEDNMFNQKVIMDQLQQTGFVADAVANGIESLEALGRIPYDLVLMDCQMPEMDGYEAAAEIRRREAGTKHTPIIAMTAHEMKEERERCITAGMDDFLSKPVRVARLEQLLVHWLSAARPPATTAPAAEQPTPAQDSPPVDMEIFLEVAGTEERIPEMARRYTEQTREHLDSLQKAIAAGAAADVKRIAHKTAGSSAMCGMNPMVALLRELERMGHERQLADAERVFARVGEEFERIEHFFNNHLEIANPPAVPVGNQKTKP